MNRQPTLNQIAHDLVCHYSEMNRSMRQYDLHVADLPDFTRHEFAAQIMKADPAYADEAVGADNEAYQKKMLPAMLRYLANTTDKDLEIEFNSAWRDGVTSYMTNRMQRLIDDALQDYNSERSAA